MSEDYRGALDAYIRTCSDDRGRQWLEDAWREATAPAIAPERLATLCAMAARRLGRTPCPGAAGALATPHGSVHLGPWSPGDAGRALLVLAAPAPTRADRCRTLYAMGDEGERISLVRALALAVADASLRDLALEAGRTNSLALFAALAHHNPYPAAVYDDHQFNQLVLKALFMGLPITAVAGLSARANAELSRMCEDYVDERRAAAREVPADIWLALVPRMSPRGRAQVMAALAAGDPAQRRHAATAIVTAGGADPGLREAVAAMLDREDDETVRAAVPRPWHPPHP